MTHIGWWQELHLLMLLIELVVVSIIVNIHVGDHEAECDLLLFLIVF